VAKHFTFIADTINGKIQEFPKAFNLICGDVKPLGCEVIRQFNKTECIVAKRVFLIYYGGDVFGSTQFTSIAQFILYMNNACRVFCTPAFFTVDHCKLTLFGCDVKFYVPCKERYLKINGCRMNINGCNLKLNY
jgi:hypothetical protein